MTYAPNMFHAGLHEPGPGKFEGTSSAELSDLIYDMMGDGVDEENGSVTEGVGWVGIMRHVSLWTEVTERGAEIVKEYGHKSLGSLRAYLVRAYPRIVSIIVTEDSQGFVGYSLHTNADEAEKEYEEIAAEYEYDLEEDDADDDV